MLAKLLIETKKLGQWSNKQYVRTIPTKSVESNSSISISHGDSADVCRNDE
jgi:hypothetical protein